MNRLNVLGAAKYEDIFVIFSNAVVSPYSKFCRGIQSIEHHEVITF